MEPTLGLALLGAGLLVVGYVTGRAHTRRQVAVAMLQAEDEIGRVLNAARKERVLLTTRAQMAEARSRALKADLAKLAKADVEAAAELRRGKKLQGAR